MQDVMQWLETSSAASWFLLVVFVVAVLDSIIPIVPSETLVILGGIAAAGGDQRLWVIIVLAALGAFCGDTIAFSIGRGAGGWLEQRWMSRPKNRARLEWAGEQIERRGGVLIVVARFIPGGRTAVTLSCGITRQQWSWFLPYAALAGVVWSIYAAGLGYFFGEQFADSHTTAFIAAFAAALGVTASLEVFRWVRARARARPSADGGAERSPD